MKEAETRTAAISKARTITIGGKSYELCQLGPRDYQRLQDEALNEYKREVISTWTKNLDLLPEEARVPMQREAFQMSSKIHASDLPAKTILMPKVENGEILIGANGEPVMVETPTPYAGWWLSETPLGKMHAIWLSMRKSDSQRHLTLDDIDEMFTDEFGRLSAQLEEVAQAVGEISKSELAEKMAAVEDSEETEGNGKVPAAVPT